MTKRPAPPSKDLKKQLDTRHLQIYVAIGQSRTLTDAAALLQLPLFTVSRALKHVEALAKVALVRRDRSGLELTSAGRDYLSACVNVLDAHATAASVLAGHRGEPEGTLRVGTPLPFATKVLGPILPQFLQRYPNIELDIDLYSSDWDQAPKAVHDIFLKVRTPRDSQHHLMMFPAILQGLFASPQYVAKHSLPESPFDLASHRLGQTRDHSAFTWKFRNGKEQVALTPNFSIVVADVEVLAQLALHSAGIAVLPVWRAHPEVTAGNLVHVLPQWAAEEVIFCALHSGRHRVTSKERALLDFLGTVLGTASDPRCNGQKPSLFFARSVSA